MSSKDKPSFAELFSPEHFRELGHEVINKLADDLVRTQTKQQAVVSLIPPGVAIEKWSEKVPEEGEAASALLQQLYSEVLEHSLRVHHPRNVGHQVSPPLPLTVLGDLISALTNQAMAVYETGPSATMIERQVIGWFCELLGWGDGDGILTSGGAMANLTALLSARQVMFDGDVWKHGVGACQFKILASEYVHYSVSRAAGIMGLGTDAVVSVSVDASGSMDMNALRRAFDDTCANGAQPFVVVGTAGCTPTGSVDPLEDLATFCAKNRLWFHVDGVHGASGLLTEKHRDALKGIELADSVTWDGHKLLYVPATVSAVLFKDPIHSYAAFSQQAPYLFQGENPTEEAFNTSYRTLECTKRMMGLKLWMAFKAYGKRQLGSLIEHVYATAQAFAAMLAESKDFELLMMPQTNIVCFRYHGDAYGAPDQASQRQAEIRRKLVESGAYHLTQTQIRGAIWLRITIMNPLTEIADLQALMEDIRRVEPDQQAC